MEKNIEQTFNWIEWASDQIHLWVLENFGNSWLLSVIVKFLVLAGISLIWYFLLRFLANLLLRTLFNFETKPVLKAIYTSRVSNSIIQIFVVGTAGLALGSVFYRHPESLMFLQRVINFSIVISFGVMMMRILKAINHFYTFKNDFYRIVALNAISQTLRTIGIFIFTIIAISVIFGIKSSTIIGSLGAITAVLVLVFRDTILGFMTGIHVATSKNLKVGDWIGIPKYNLEGKVMEINIITTKIQNFDKTISTIPTYDLLSTEIRNNQVMAEGNQRRIKKSIVFNINSFRFVDDAMFERWSHINLISEYLDHKRKEIAQERKSMPNSEELINGRQLTNIGVYRRYAINYLRQNPDIDQEEVLLVRQLNITAEGMPLEIYAFANKTELEDYEDIQADIFDHLLASAKIFDLEVMQMPHF